MIDFRSTPFLKSLGVVLVATLAASVIALPASAQQLTAERLFLLAPQVVTGSGTTRLDGMGGFETAVPDENLEITMWDFSNNPAGFSQDRDSWNLEFRYGHSEFAERDRRLSGNDLSINDGTVRGGYYSRNKIGVGAQLDYAEVSTNSFSRIADSYQVSGFRVDGNTYLSQKLSLGARIGLSSESQEEFSSAVYRINHDNSSLRGGLGLSYDVAPGIKVGARGELIGTTIDGLSRGPFHTDNFDWSRPGGLVAVQGFISRGRLQGAVDFTNQEINGEESVRISWSERFIFNPTPDELTANLDTFTEKRTNDQLRTRWRLLINPRLTVSLATQNGSEDFTVITNPNALGSRGAAEVASETSAIIGGANWYSQAKRLLLAAEFKTASSKVQDDSPDRGVENTLDQTALRAGAEYFFGETVVGRGGLIYQIDDYAFEDTPNLDETYTTVRVAGGLGLIPTGAIWQFDLALDAVLSSDLDNKQINFGAYVKYLF